MVMTPWIVKHCVFQYDIEADFPKPGPNAVICYITDTWGSWEFTLEIHLYERTFTVILNGMIKTVFK